MLEGTVERLRTLALAADDASGHFPAMYARVTLAVDEAIAAGRFGDGTRMVRFAEAFAAWYVRAAAPGSTPGPVVPAPFCWRAAFDVAGDGRLLIVQHLLLGMNAHINHDLPQVVVELAGTAGDLAALRPDFDAVNDLLAETHPVILRDLAPVSMWVNRAAALGGGRLFNFSLTVARNQAWRAATRLHRLDEDGRAADVAELDRLVAVLAYLITRPDAPVAWLVPLARRCEEHDPRRTTAALLGPLA
jgi:hypothetical protein